MHFAEYGDSFLLAQFREFYLEATRLESLVKSGAWVYLPEPGFQDDEGSSYADASIEEATYPSTEISALALSGSPAAHRNRKIHCS